ncbi:Transposable element Tcb2 transposase [Anthophora retusa]
MSAAYASRFEAVFLCNHPKGPKMSFAAASRYMGKSVSFIKKCVKRYEDVKNVDDLPERGKRCSTSEKDDKAILRIFEKNPGCSLRKAKLLLAKKGVEVSLNTIRCRLRDADYGWRCTKLKPFFSEKHVEKRVLWARANIDRDFSNIIFTDESSFWAWGTRRHAWSPRAVAIVQRTVKHPVKVLVWGCFCKQGFGALYLFTDDLNAQKMIQIYQRCLLKSARRWFGSDNSLWVLQEDNDPKHRSRACTEWKRENGIRTLDWPSQSPDANPIENVWAAMKVKLREKRVYNVKQLTRHIRQIWRSLPEIMAENLAESMPKRCQAIIDNDGDWTTY